MVELYDLSTITFLAEEDVARIGRRWFARLYGFGEKSMGTDRRRRCLLSIHASSGVSC